MYDIGNLYHHYGFLKIALTYNTVSGLSTLFHNLSFLKPILHILIISWFKELLINLRHLDVFFLRFLLPNLSCIIVICFMLYSLKYQCYFMRPIWYIFSYIYAFSNVYLFFVLSLKFTGQNSGWIKFYQYFLNGDLLLTHFLISKSFFFFFFKLDY